MTFKGFKLIDEKTGKEIAKGELRKSFRGEPYTVDGFEPPRHAGSSGRIYVYPVEGKREGFTESYFPRVFGAEIVEA